MRNLFLAARMLMLVAAVTTAVAQSHDHTHIGYVPREFMDRPIALHSGIGVFHEQVTTSSSRAQNFYDQGQEYLHSYMWIEAARSFNQALRLDPKLAMAYLGLSYAYSPIDYAAAVESLDHGAALSNNLTDREKRRIEVRRLQLEAMRNPQDSSILAKVRESLDIGLQLYPADLELLLLRGNAEEPTPFSDGQGCVPSAMPYYEKALKNSDANFAAEHYLAHCYENMGRATAAIAHAQKYASEAPNVPHAQHMLGHEFRRNGQIGQAIVQFRKADALEMKAARAESIPSFLNWHHAHNLALLADCYQAIGRMKSAEATLREEIALPAFTDYAMLNRGNWPLFLLTRNRFAEAKRAAEAMQALPSPLAQAAGHALAGLVELNLSRSQSAGAELEIAGSISSRLNSADSGAVRPYLLVLDAALHIQTGQAPEALKVLHELIRRIQASNNPDAWGVSLLQLESLSALARKAGSWDIAAEAAQAMIDHDPSYAAGHFALALCAEHESDFTSAKSEFQKASQLWTNADPDLTELHYARKHVAEPITETSSNSGIHNH